MDYSQNSDITQSSETQPVSPVVEKKRVKEKPSVPDPDGKVKIQEYIYTLLRPCKQFLANILMETDVGGRSLFIIHYIL